jgi:flagellum-specific peptidoglycan hydrolase FlgJ
MASRGSFLSKAYAAARQAGLPDAAARVAASQAALESNYGKSAPGNNFFGIKAGKSWKGATQKLKTWEVVAGKKVSIKDSFRKYTDFKQSFKDWAKLVGRNWPGVLTAQTFEDAVAMRPIRTTHPSLGSLMAG